MRGQAGVFAGQNAALVGHKLPEQIGVLEIQRVGGEIDFRFRTRRADFRGAARTAAIPFVGVGFAWHRLFDFAMKRMTPEKLGYTF